MIRPVSDRVKWILGESEGFSFCNNPQELPQFDFKVHTPETIVGVYENYPGEFKEVVVITDKGIHVGSESRWEFLHFERMKTVAFPMGKTEHSGIPLDVPKHLEESAKYKKCMDHLILDTKDHEQFIFPVRWGSGVPATSVRKLLVGIINGLESEKRRQRGEIE